MSISENCVNWYIKYEDHNGNEQVIRKAAHEYADAIASLCHLKSRDLYIIETNVQ